MILVLTLPFRPLNVTEPESSAPARLLLNLCAAPFIDCAARDALI